MKLRSINQSLTAWKRANIASKKQKSERLHYVALTCSIIAIIIFTSYLYTRHNFRTDFISKSSDDASNQVRVNSKVETQQSLSSFTSHPLSIHQSDTKKATIKLNSSSANAILYLAHQGAIFEAAKSLKLLFDNFNTRYRYPVIVFYDDNNGIIKFDIPKLFELAQLNDADKALVEFEYLQFVFPSGVTKDDISKVFVWQRKFPYYQHLLAFWGYHVFHHPRVTSLEYYWRLDTDTFLFEPVKYDFFRKLRVKNVHYAYRISTEDPEWSVRGMAKFFGKYVRDNNLTVAQPQNLQGVIGAYSELVSVPTYYDNFEIVHVPTFLRPDMEQFRKAFYDTKRIYTHRWGDAPQRYLMVNLFLNEAEVYKVCECAYEHQQLREPASC